MSCPVCGLAVPTEELRRGESLEPSVVLIVSANVPWWKPALGICANCEERFSRARDQGPTLFSNGALPILPVGLRLGASEQFTGRRVTMAFLDAGFYAHPDLVEPRNRIRDYVDLTNPRATIQDLERPTVSSWHGMMTSVVACGNGRLSQGLYKGLASSASVVLVKCGSVERIRHDDIRRGLDWVLENRRRYRIRIVNVSCGGDYEASYLGDPLSRSAEALVAAGVFVCAAAGNQGHTARHAVVPPASAPSVLTVGGLDDKNSLAFGGYDMYHSSYGPTVDGLQKPEVVAPGIWVAAPILPGTPTAAQAELLSRLAVVPDDELRSLIAAHSGVDAALDAARDIAPPLIRQLVQSRLRDNNVISSAYKHVDGTSFAAPIVSSLAAQMLEANPKLTPQQIKLILIRTARRLPHIEPDRQGWGVVDAGRAVREALS